MKNTCCHCGFKKNIFKQIKNEDNNIKTVENICKECYIELLDNE